MEPEERNAGKTKDDRRRLPVYIGLVSEPVITRKRYLRVLVLQVPEKILGMTDANCFKQNNSIMIVPEDKEEIFYPSKHKRHGPGKIKGRLLTGNMKLTPRTRIRGYITKEELLGKILPRSYKSPEILRVIDLMYKEKEDVTYN